MTVHEEEIALALDLLDKAFREVQKKM